MGNKKSIIILIIVLIALNSIVFYAIVKLKQADKIVPVAEDSLEKMVAKNNSADIEPEENKTENSSNGNNGTNRYLKCVWGRDEKFMPYIAYFDGATRIRNETRIPLDPAFPEKGRAYEIIDKGLHYEWDFSSSNGRKEIIPLEKGYTYEESFARMMENVTGDNDYTCQPWKADENLFSPPANINFINIKEESQKTTPFKCAWNDTSKEYESYFGSNWKTYNKVKIKSSGKTDYQIYDGKWIYRWTSNEKEGTKTVFIPEDIASEASDAREEVIKASKYSCQEWTADENLFIAPLGIKFIEKKY